MAHRTTLRTVLVAGLFVLAIGCLACGPADTEEESMATAQPSGPPTLEEIGNATFAGIYDQPVQLQDGRYEGQPFDPGGASRPAVGLVEDIRLVGDLNGDGAEEVAVVLWESSGGSGTFTYLAVVGRIGGEVVNLATTEIGDRVQLRDARVTEARIELDVVQAGPGDAACCPGEVATLAWALEGDVLNPVGSGVEAARLSVAALAGPEWVLTQLERSEPAPLQPEITLLFEEGRIAGVSGCNRYMGKVTDGESPGDLTVELLAGTRMACAPEVMELELRYGRQLESVVKYGFMNRQLALTFEQDEGTVEAMLFAPRDPGT